MMSNDQISDTQLLRDIENTQKEYEAYIKLSEGYDILSKLPENSGGTGSLHFSRSLAFGDSATSCLELLDRLKELKAERGLE
jgi:hypothetical protein